MLLSSSVGFGWSSTLPIVEFAPDESLSEQEMIPKLNINSRKMVKILFIFFYNLSKVNSFRGWFSFPLIEYSSVVKRPVFNAAVQKTNWWQLLSFICSNLRREWELSSAGVNFSQVWRKRWIKFLPFLYY